MNFDWEKVRESKEAYRRKLTAKPYAEKLRIVEDLAEMALALRPHTAPSPPNAPWRIPPHWKWKKMADVATVIGGSTPATDHKEYFGGDIPWITPADLSRYTNKTISRGARNSRKRGWIIRERVCCLPEQCFSVRALQSAMSPLRRMLSLQTKVSRASFFAMK
jgi:hypothetical protein